MIKTIYLDMDGVLADFDKHFENLYGISPKGYEAKHGQIAFWRTIYKTPRYFEDIPINPKVYDIINMCKALTLDVCILSSPSSTNQPLCMLGKRKWIDKHLGVDFPAIFEKHKEKYAEPTALLVDDYDKQINNFTNAGGRAFKYDMNKHEEFEDFMLQLSEGK